MNGFASEAKVGDGGLSNTVPVWNVFRPPRTRDKVVAFRRIVLVGQTALGERLDLDGIRLCSAGRCFTQRGEGPLGYRIPQPDRSACEWMRAGR